MLLEVLQLLEIAHHRDHLRGGRDECLRLAGSTLPHGFQLVDEDELAHVVRDVGDVVDLRREADDVLAVQRGDERLVELAHDLVGQLVAVVLDGVDVTDLLLHVGEVGEEAIESLRGLERVLCVLAELREEDVLTRDQR